MHVQPGQTLERAAQRVPFDWFGSLLACFGLGSLVVMASLLALDVIPVLAVIVSGVVGAVCCWFAIRHFRRAPHPIMGLEAFRLETFRVSHAGGSLFRLAVSAVPFVLPLLFQDARRFGSLVLVTVEAPELRPLQAALAKDFDAWLIAQDRQKFRPHVTLLNKVTPAQSIVAHAQITATWARWTGEAGLVRSLDVRFTSNAFAGEVLVAGGVIEDVVDPADGDRVATCTVWLCAEDGRDVVRGTARVVLPPRSTTPDDDRGDPR